MNGNEKKSKAKYMEHQPSERHAVAYCHSPEHKGYLSPNIIRRHNCLDKQCTSFEKLPGKAFWYKRRIKNCLKKIHRGGKGMLLINGREFHPDSMHIDQLAGICLSEYVKTGEEPEIGIQNGETAGQNS